MSPNKIKNNIINSTNKTEKKSTDKKKIDISPLRIPSDKASYNKYKNININVFQNIINYSKKTSNVTNTTNATNKDEEDKMSYSINKQNPYIGKINKLNENKISKEKETKNKTSVNSKINSIMKSGSLNSMNMSKATLTSNFTGNYFYLIFKKLR